MYYISIIIVNNSDNHYNNNNNKNNMIEMVTANTCTYIFMPLVRGPEAGQNGDG